MLYMELVFILSISLLLGTIILCALSAYLLYMIRELKSQELRSQAEQRKTERQQATAPPLPEQPVGNPSNSGQPAPAALYVAPAPAPPPSKPIIQRKAPPNGNLPSLQVTPTPPSETTQAAFFWEYTETGFVPVRPRKTEPAQTKGAADEEDEAPAWL